MFGTWDREAMDRALRRAYYSRPNWIDGTDTFRNLRNQYIQPGSRVLDIGAGRGTGKHSLLDRARRVYGLDLDPRVRENALISAAVLGDVQRLPFSDETFDVATADYVVEHLADPRAALLEIHRVLRPSGWFIFRTPNVMHYAGAIARCTPHVVHERVANRARGFRADEENDVFPAHYGMNTRSRVYSICGRTGFAVRELLMVEREPSYLMFNRFAFSLGHLYERVVNSSEIFSGFRSNMFVACQRLLV